MIVKKVEGNNKKRRLYGHSYRPFSDLERLLRAKGLYPKEKKKS